MLTIATIHGCWIFPNREELTRDPLWEDLIRVMDILTCSVLKLNFIIHSINDQGVNTLLIQNSNMLIFKYVYLNMYL